MGGASPATAGATAKESNALLLVFSVVAPIGPKAGAVVVSSEEDAPDMAFSFIVETTEDEAFSSCDR